ncbi:hypothetical protein ACFO4E_14130 [Nocardiopsis mangrovi]|uniref:Uncharacterized protein n=1 Tax=Nocardiopsis mangrovi TaxID=1179818 RepID=A0ABV9DX75_9ACTN
MNTSHRTATQRITTTLAVLALGAATAATPAEAATYPGQTVSRYTPLAGGSAERTAARDAGCAEGRTGRDGVRVLFFGTQEKGDKLRQPGTTSGSTSARVAASTAADVATAWAEGFTECRTGGATADLAMGVNNKSDGGIDGAAAGRAWAAIVDGTADTEAVTITGAVDAEPAWSSPSWARGWVDAFTQASDHTLYAANSADGCPTHGSSSTSCNNGWKLADLHYVATGAAPTIKAIPQIYRTDGIQARQWSAISSWGATKGSGPVRFAGAMSQEAACKQRGGCSTTDNSPKDAWNQLYTELNAHSETKVDSLPVATDMRWA